MGFVLGALHLKEQIAQQIRTKSLKLELYKIPDDNPLPLEHLKTTKIPLADLGQRLAPDPPLTSVFELQPAANHLHLVVVNNDISLFIRCWIRGGSVNTPIELEVPRNETVLHLPSVMQGKSTQLTGVSLEQLQPYKFSYRQQEDLRVIVQNTGMDTLLPKDQRLRVTFNDVPLNEDTYVIVDMVGLKRKRLRDLEERASKKPKVSPSNFGVQEYHDTQADMDTRFLDFRTPKTWYEATKNPPTPLDSLLPPFEVLYIRFGEFLDTYRAQRQTNVVGGSAFVRHEVEMFAEDMALIVKSESSKQSRALTRLNRVFFRSPHPVIVRTGVENTLTDGHFVYGDDKIPYLFIEFRNEDAGFKPIPSVQLASYYQASIRAVQQKHNELIQCSRFPALGITIVGPIVTFCAMCWVGWVVIFPLTSGISCVSRAGGGDDRRTLRAAFSAAIDLVAGIKSDAGQLDPSAPLLSHIRPDTTELPTSLDPQVSIEFQICDILHWGSGRIVYRAKSVSPDLDLVVKITPSYSTALHAFCASRGHAPAIRGFKRFPGNVTVLAMDYLEGDHLGPEGSQAFRDKMAEQLKQLIKDVHLAGYVHGDLRLPNVYCVGDKVMLIDFDWGGQVGEAFDPHQILHSELVEGRDMDSLMITKEDDERILKKSLKSIGCS